MMNIRNAGVLSLLLAAFWLAGCTTPPPAAPVAVTPPPARVDDRMDGVWAPQKAEMAGRDYRLPAEFRLEVRGTRFSIRDGARPDAGALEFLGTEPAGLNVVGEEGPTKGRKLLAIYRFNSPTELEICYDLSGTARPTAFASLPESQLFRITYRRVQ